MSERADYTEFHPRWLRRRPSTYWWLERGSYLRFIARELSSVFIAWFVAYLLLLVRAVSRGDAAYQRFLTWSRHPLVLALNVVTLAFVLLHAVTWFNLAPRAMVVRVGSRRVPPALIGASNYLAWAVVTALVLWLLVGG
jgi:fumarate reductase subunit C